MKQHFPIACVSAIALSGCVADVDPSDGQDEIAVVEEGLSSSYMACYVDTLAYDLYQPNWCVSYGTAPKTVADFKIFPNGTPTSIVWAGHAECNGSTTCVVPIRLQRAITLSASYYVNGVLVTSKATARYETSN